MQSIIKLSVPFLALFVFTSCTAQIPHPKTETVLVYGNCGMCEKTIEKAAYIKGAAKADWDQDSKMATLTFDSTQTNADAILQRIAAAGYDSEKFKAPESAYASLAECCQYDRPQPAVVQAAADIPVAQPPATMVKKQAVASTEPGNPLSAVYTAYFGLKDALVATDGKAAAQKAQVLAGAIAQVKMDQLNADQHAVWMKYAQKLTADVDAIQGVTNTDRQREHFAALSKNMYAVLKVGKADAPVYYEFCPMYGDGKSGHWLSAEPTINNPYFGDKMLHCGSVQETLK